MSAQIVSYNDSVRAVIRAVSDFGFATFDLAGPPRRLSSPKHTLPLIESGVDVRRVKVLQTPSTLYRGLPPGESWLGVSQRTLARIWAAFLVGEDPQRRLDAQRATPLMHQLSLVQHVFEKARLRKVLIADEVGLGKTIEAGLIVKRLIDSGARLRILYLAPARLVSNVAFEFRDKLDLDARCWVAGSGIDARLDSDRLVVASIHKAVFGANMKVVVESGPWDVLIVDECHHLSDWGHQGGSANRFYRLVSQLAQGIPTNGRLILMSGTPHQGSATRFRNILRLLSDDGNSVDSAAGRVIFRTKDRVRDWKGKPLFPGREIHQPHVVQLGETYEQWYRAVGALYDTTSADGARGRASGWAKGQALQWAASSVQAGLGFLIRLAMRRLGWTLKNDSLTKAISALRPYRGGDPEESLVSLFQRLQKQVGAQLQAEDTLGDDEELDEEEWRPDPRALSELLVDGVSLIQSGVANTKWEALIPLIREAGEEKIVFFAQPVETVTFVKHFLRNRFGQEPCIVIGNQSEEERREQVASFQDEKGPRFLVSSRAGGEGLNMQCARRLIHLDVPWNPMELEQRIGRVHRFGSRQTVIVDTIVAAGSREINMYQAAREKLRIIAQQLDPEEFELLFSRVMTLVPPKEFEDILRQSDLLSGGSASDQIGKLVTEGYKAWREFDDEYYKNSEQIQSLNPGQASLLDLTRFLIKYCGAIIGPTTTRTLFEHQRSEIVAIDEEISTLVFGDAVYACEEWNGVVSKLVDGRQIAQLGLNVPAISKEIGAAFFPDRPVGAAYLNRPPDLGEHAPPGPFALLFLLRQTLSFHGERQSEAGLTFHAFRISGEPYSAQKLSSQAAAELLRKLSDSSRIKDPSRTNLEDAVVEREIQLVEELRRPTEKEIEARLRHVVWPVGAIIVA